MQRDLHRQNYWAWLASTLGGALLVLMLASGAMAQVGDVRTYTWETFVQWLAKYKDAKPDFKPGDVITSKDLARIVPFVPPGVLEEFDFPQWKIPIIAPVDHTPRQDYMNCTEKYQSQVRLGADGALENFVCGQPFPNSSITLDDPNSGQRAVWNFEFRWQNMGLAIHDVVWVWDRFGGTHVSPKIVLPPPNWQVNKADYLKSGMDLSYMFGGVGTFQRTLQGPYQRVLYSHLAMLNGGALRIPGAKDMEFKEFTGFHDPFDIRGTAFIIYRYTDPHRVDDAWAYIPNLRRVRRISVEVKSDSLMGTDDTLEDFYGFAGRPLDWTWKFLGWKDALVIQDSKWDDEHLYGPMGFTPDDVWEIRRTAVIERTSKDSRNPYSTVIDFWDAQNWDTSWELAWDHKNKLWKIWDFQKVWTESYHDSSLQAINKGVRTTTFQGVQTIDVQNHRATLIPCMGSGWPVVDPSEVENVMDVSKLEQTHR